MDLTHAFKHRLRGIDVLESLAMQKAEAMGRKLCEEVALGKLPFLDLPFKNELENALPACLNHFKDKKHMLLLGIGGSALGARVLQKAFSRGQDCPEHKGKSLWIADNVDTSLFDAWLEKLQAEETIVAVISKSGTTIETMAQFFLAQEWLKAKLPTTWRDHLVFITDEETGALREMAGKEAIPTLPVPDNLGGRYSIFSAVGMLPAAFLGVDYKALLEGAQNFGTQTLSDIKNLKFNPAMQLAVWHYELLSKGYSELIFFSYIPAWQYLGNWFAQLWAESLGKKGKGSAPFSASGVTDQHSTNQMFLDGQRNKACLFLSCNNLPAGAKFPSALPKGWDFLQGKNFGDLLAAESIGTRMSLVQHAVPLAHLSLGVADEQTLGKTMQLLMLSTILTGWLLEINPVDQPAVELGKCLANAKLGSGKDSSFTRELEKFLDSEEKSTNKIAF